MLRASILSKPKTPSRGQYRKAGRPGRHNFRPHLECLEIRTLLNAGDLDPTFDADGKTTTDFLGATEDRGYEVALQPDGKIVVVGHRSGVTPERGFSIDLALARYNADGSLLPVGWIATPNAHSPDPHNVMAGNIVGLNAGGGGRDLLIGGIGSDRLVGNDEDDILIAGFTAHDANDAALCAILKEWSRTDLSYEQRVQSLQSGVGPGGIYRLDSSTVAHDSSSDVLTGSSGLDWFLFDSSRDRVTDLNDEAFANDLSFILS